MSSGIEVRGGAHGVAVRLDELEAAAGVLDRVGLDVAESAVVVGLTLTEPALAAAGLVAPVEYALAEAAILRCSGRSGATGLSAEVLATAVASRAAVVAYRRGEQAAEALFDGVASVAGLAVGAAIVPVGLGLGAVALSPGAALALRVPGAHEAAVSLGLGLGREADEILLDHPWLVPAAADGLDGLVIGMGLGTPALGTWLSWRSGRLGVRYPPRNREEALAVVLASAKGAALDESRHDVDVRARPVEAGRGARDVADLVDPAGPTSGGSRVRVTGVPQADGSWTWVVDVPGTQTFAPQAGDNPWDLTSNVLLSAGQQTLTTQAVTRAVADAQRRAGATGRSRVLLSGHSQGGITAAALAADPRFRERFGVTHVVTSGAPVANVDVPEDVEVLSLEHEEDLVPGLEGEDNPDRPSWVTVRRDIGDELGDDGRATEAHASHRYADTARLVDASDDPSLAAWRRGAADYLSGGDAVVIDYDIERVPGR